MIEKFKGLDDNKKIPIVIGINLVLIILIIVYACLRSNSSYKTIMEDDKKTIVYTSISKKNDDFFINVPYVNIKDLNSVNEDIDLYVSDFTDNEMVRLTYEYEINGKVLSLVIKAIDYDTDDVPDVHFKTYNINLDTKTLLSDDDMLSLYNVTYDDVYKVIEKKFKYWYKDLIKKEYFDEEECDYESFLENRDVEDYMDNISYYIEEGKLVAYKPFVFYSIIGEESYFKEKDFKFVISK